jgi:RND family efflux transporter MFP subunit
MSDPLSDDLASLRIRSEDAPPSNRGAWLAGGVFVLLLGVGAAWGYRAVSARVFKTDVHVTSIQLVSPSQGSVELNSTGYVVAQTTSKLAAKLPGRLAFVAVREGERVKQGQLVARLDDTEEKVAAAGARARLDAARAALAGLQRQLARQQELLTAGVSQRSTVEDLDAKVKEQAATAHLAETDLQAATVRLAETQIVSPINGTLVSKPRQVGEFVDPITEPVAEISDFDSMVVETDVPEGRLSKVKIGGPAEIVLDAFPDRHFRGEAAEIVPFVDRAKATVVVKVKFVDPHDGVLPDMAARVAFLQAPLDAAALQAAPKRVVPASALVDRGGQKAVFAVEDGHARLRSVVVGEKVGTGFELKSGPKSGTRVVADPPDTLVDGAPVQERTEE